MNNKETKGLIHIYTGDGKGKTTASLGLAVRAVGAGMNVLFCQFLKGQDTSELEILKKLGINVIRTDEVKKFIPFMSENEKKECEISVKMCYNKLVLLFNEYDVIILDEVIAAVAMSMLTIEELLSLIGTKPYSTELVLTGRNAPDSLVALADYVSDIQSVKHPYDKGITARKGIEF